jgi:hypothetical protein
MYYHSNILSSSVLNDCYPTNMKSNVRIPRPAQQCHILALLSAIEPHDAASVDPRIDPSRISALEHHSGVN